ncbi:MAG: protein kinase domain-containing protein, partial [Nannocystaceae bacterium]
MGEHYQILIIEDSPEDSEFYRRALESDPNNHYRVFEVNSGVEALALVPELAIDLVLLDFHLPDMTGLELFAKLCDDISCVIPTIMLTGQGGEAIAVKAMKLGVEDYLVKGQYSPAGLRKAVEAIVRKPSEDGVLEVGSIFASRYEIVRLAGSGGMSSVYRALDRNTETYVALKVVRSPDHRLSSRFRREASVLAELDSATIVRYLGHGLTPDGDRFLAMEWLEGEDLATHLTNGPLSIEDTMSVAHRVADALKIAHKHGLIHRDVKPSNLFLPGKEISQAKLLDFGIALTTEADLSRFTRTGAAMGTPGYMAPEQALGLQTIDHRADIYGLGALLYHCL